MKSKPYRPLMVHTVHPQPTLLDSSQSAEVEQLLGPHHSHLGTQIFTLPANPPLCHSDSSLNPSIIPHPARDCKPPLTSLAPPASTLAPPLPVLHLGAPPPSTPLLLRLENFGASQVKKIFLMITDPHQQMKVILLPPIYQVTHSHLQLSNNLDIHQ